MAFRKSTIAKSKARLAARDNDPTALQAKITDLKNTLADAKSETVNDMFRANQTARIESLEIEISKLQALLNNLTTETN